MMEIKVRCRKEGDAWIIEDPGPVFIRERRVLWTFEGLEPGIVPLLDFKDNRPHGPFPDTWLTASTIAAELEELPAHLTAYDYDIVLVQWDPDPNKSKVVKRCSHMVKAKLPKPVQIKVSWRDGEPEVRVHPEICPVGAADWVEWLFDIPDHVFATIDFGPWSAGGLRPLGPFAELHGRRVAGMYRITGQTDLLKATYRYSVSLYDRKTEKVLRHDPKIDNNGVPPD
jgi:hypothetical protein